MKQYYLNNGTEQLGPFDIEDLRQKQITKSTPIWYEGLSDWTIAGNVEDLNELFETVNTPPPFSQKKTTAPPVHPAKNQNAAQQPKKKSRAGLIIGIILMFVLILIAGVIVVNNPNAIPGVKIEVNTPKPVIITSSTDNSKSGLLKLRTTVYATVQNQGGAGNVLVTFYVTQDQNDYERVKSIYLQANESQDLNVTFEEVKMLGGKITYNVETRAE